MADNKTLKPNYLFEVSWEVCNKLGGIYTVVSTKALTLQNEFSDNYFLIGPEVWKESKENPEFIEDKLLFKALKESAEKEGLFFRIGRWNIKGSPIVILVDFTPFFPLKDKILARFWEKYQLDSITGGWDYIEPALFGYAAARVIEHFYKHNLSAADSFVAHFHEWMTGSGILYLKDQVPQAATVFTTHATVTGRSIAGNQMPLYSALSSYDGDVMASQLGVKAKHSMEKICANECDAFTTVSELTVNECKQFLDKNVDVVTPNGFEDSFVPKGNDFDAARTLARHKLFQVSESVLGYQLKPDTLFVVNSGRYEFRNKGIDVFIDALSELNTNDSLQKDIVAYITVPAHQIGPKAEVIARIEDPASDIPNYFPFLTHDLFDTVYDPTIERIRENEMLNAKSDRVKIIFVPAYLNGNDGVFNMDYYDLLIGFDLSLFPSYYEPWGYTPLESLAFKVPTVTTSLTGFGIWMKEKAGKLGGALYVVERNENNTEAVVEEMASIIRNFSLLSEAEVFAVREKAGELAQEALWTNLVFSYYDAFSIALRKSAKRSALYAGKQSLEYVSAYDVIKSQRPVWKKVMIETNLPASLSDLQLLSRNLWWTWNFDAKALFESINPSLWAEANYNPITLIELLRFDELKKLSEDADFLYRLSLVSKNFKDYMSQASKKPAGKVAYFSMEFGLDDTLKIFSGGLGMLAGDYLKEASDSNKDITGIGLLYRYGYFNQSISMFGDQISEYFPQKFTHLPIQPVRNEADEWIVVDIALPGRTLYAKVWRVDVGRVPLYLLDTDIEENSDFDKAITHQLYGGDWENRFKQELLLGVGGIRMLAKVGIKPDIYHCNEGHAAFIGLERLRNLIQNRKLSFYQAVEVVRASTLFTTHTPVPAGHDEFSEDLLRTYIPHYADRLGISWDTFMDLGRTHEGKHDEKFSMSILAAKLSQEINGVSRIHGRVSQEMFTELYPGYFPEEIHVGYVTNGVHMPTWTAKPWRELYSRTFGDHYIHDQSNPEHWEKIHQVDSAEIWKIRNKLRQELIDYIKLRVTEDQTHRQENPRLILEAMDKLNDKTLTIGFARRFATYKRAHLLFSNLDRLNDILNHKDHPVQLLYAGKAHPHDKAGQDLIKRILEVSRRPEFLGKVIFIENYDMALAKKLISGVDIWLNTPTRPLEASGTSGEKAVMNGVVNFSVLDGWWAEGYRPDAGWALKEARTYTNQNFQDELDAETIYTLLEEEIVPKFYNFNDNNVPTDWINFIKNTIAGIAPHFTMKRQLDDYYTKYYHKLFERTKQVRADNFKVANDLALWKRKLTVSFDSLEVVSMKLPDSTHRPLQLGEPFIAEIVIDVNELKAEDIGIEVILGTKINDEVKTIGLRQELERKDINGSHVTFYCEIPVGKSGVYDFAFRIFPKNSLLPHRQDLSLIRWI
ncbi:MAG: alpha-glucan family phosphorylase [Bacteroidota bacterium]